MGPRRPAGGRPERRHARPRAALHNRLACGAPSEEIIGDKQNAARVAWATIKLSQIGQRPVRLDQLATQVGLPVAETARLLHLTWQERIDLRDGMIRLDATPAGPRRYQVHADGRPVGAGKGCSVDMYLLALALGRPIHAEATCPATGTPIRVDITPERVERIDSPTAVVAVVNLDADLTLGPDRTDADVCAQQPFSASAEAASGWLAAHPQGRLIPVRSFHAEARRLIDRLEATPPATPNDMNAAGGDRA
jgi:alkylmercury lyase